MAGTEPARKKRLGVMGSMSVIALVTWIITALGGLFLLAIWLIEYDPDYQRAAATRLPIPVISGHVLCALGGMAAWIMYLVTGNDNFAWAAVVLLGAVAALGLTMAVRWLGVYRSSALPGRDRPRGSSRYEPSVRPPDAWNPVEGWQATAGGGMLTISEIAVPPERHFPLAVVIAHGLFAFTTIVLVILTVLGVAGS